VKQIELGGDSEWNGVERLVLEWVSGLVIKEWAAEWVDIVERLVLDQVSGWLSKNGRQSG
jgi:hypothetical protein